MSSSLGFTVMLLITTMLANGVTSDVAQDKQECEAQLVNLSPCLPFVGGDSKAPSVPCCANLRKDLDETRRCLCMLIRDRDEPGLGFKLNATLALALPSICHSPSNASHCPALLHLDPNSPDAQVFEQFTNASYAGSINGDRSSLVSSNGLAKGPWRVGVALWLLLNTLVDMV
ncbi:non-specific lipid transfer protein GPI-anchored 13 [Eucalyptus grandis]|uniref:non-specific lipid transfer protein GPI-anchored 13 n=1 Tax=Eucalyptus grandis TaxID=71139 RepID=UPI00192EB5CF|nr:non-specific lipid transfer protein GPI-anchored 13 [Eucalyptus grandis]